MTGFAESLKSITPYAGPITAVSGILTQYAGARQAGRDSRAAAEYEAAQLTQNAGQAQAASQRKAIEERRKGRLIQSRAQALLAASGGASSPGAVDILSDIDAEGFYRSQLALFAGDDRARSLRMAAAGSRYRGQIAQSAYKGAGRNAILRGASLFAKYAPTVTDDSFIDAGTPAFSPYG